jgi:hypothetical protein
VNCRSRLSITSGAIGASIRTSTSFNLTSS